MKHAYSRSELVTLLGTTRAATDSLIETVFKGPRDVFSVKDLGLLRRAKDRSDRRPGGARQGQLDFDQPMRPTTWLPPPVSRDAETLFARGVALEADNSPEAVESYTEALAVNPGHADAHVNLGRLLHQRGRFQEAEAHYQAALVTRPDDSTALFNLAVALEDQGRLDEAIATYQQTLEADPACVDAYFNVARLYEKKGEKVAALRHLKDYRRLTVPGR